MISICTLWEWLRNFFFFTFCTLRGRTQTLKMDRKNIAITSQLQLALVKMSCGLLILNISRTLKKNTSPVIEFFLHSRPTPNVDEDIGTMSLQRNFAQWDVHNGWHFWVLKRTLPICHYRPCVVKFKMFYVPAVESSTR